MEWPLVGGVLSLLALNGLCVDVGMVLGWEKSHVVADDGDAYGRRHLLEGVV